MGEGEVLETLPSEYDNPPRESIHSRLFKSHKDLTRKLEEKKELYDKLEQEDVTFRPQILRKTTTEKNTLFKNSTRTLNIVTDEDRITDMNDESDSRPRLL